MSTHAAHVWRARDIELEALDPHSVTPVRLFKHPGADWDPPDPVYRDQRVDPPPGHETAFAVLYTGATLPCAAVECRLLNIDDKDQYTWAPKRAASYWVVRYDFSETSLFVPIDGKNKERFGLDRPEAQFKGYEPTRVLALQLYLRFGKIAHGMSWESFHRNQPGRAYAIWHDRKNDMGLRIASTKPYLRLPEDPEWLAFLKGHPHIDAVAP